MGNFKAAVKASAAQDDSAYWIYPPGVEPLVENCDHEAARAAGRRTKTCKVCGAVRYERVSNFIKGGDVPGDNKNLAMRDTRFAVTGILANELYTQQAKQFHPELDSQDFNALIDRAARDAGIWTKAEWGTGVHAWGEDVDNGDSPSYPLAKSADLDNFGPALRGLSESWRDRNAFKLFQDNFKKMRKDVQAYMILSEAHGFEWTKAEAVVVLDEYEVAGKLDRLGNVAPTCPLYCCEKPHVGDIKTGSVEHGKRTKVMQFGSYALGKLYNPKTRERIESGACTKTAYIMHIPKEKPSIPELVAVPIGEARELLDLAQNVWTKHSVKNYFKSVGVAEYIAEKINSVSDETELEEFYERTGQCWTDEHVALASAKFN